MGNGHRPVLRGPEIIKNGQTSPFFSAFWVCQGLVACTMRSQTNRDDEQQRSVPHFTTCFTALAPSVAMIWSEMVKK